MHGECDRQVGRLWPVHSSLVAAVTAILVEGWYQSPVLMHDIGTLPWPKSAKLSLVSLVHIGCQNKCRCILQSVFQATTSSCMSRIMADLWGERAPKGLSEDLDAWQYWQCPLRVGQGLSTRAVMISCGAPRTCVLASWILWLAATGRWKACAPRLAAAWTSFVACLHVESYWW